MLFTIAAPLIQPAIQVLVTLIVHAEGLFGSNQGTKKRKEVWTQLGQRLYDVADGLAGFDAEKDNWIKNTLIPMAIDTAVDFFNRYQQRQFNLALVPMAVQFVLDRVPEITAA